MVAPVRAAAVVDASSASAFSSTMRTVTVSVSSRRRPLDEEVIVTLMADGLPQEV